MNGLEHTPSESLTIDNTDLRTLRWQELLKASQHGGYVDLLANTVGRDTTFDKLAAEGPLDETALFLGPQAARAQVIGFPQQQEPSEHLAVVGL